MDENKTPFETDEKFQTPPPEVSHVKENESAGMAIATLVLGIFSIVCGWACCGPIPAIVGLILGIVSKEKTPDDKESMRKIGLILCIIGLALFVIGCIFLVVLAVISPEFNREFRYNFNRYSNGF